MTTKKNSQQGILTAIDVDTSSAEYFRPDTTWRTVTILGARRPTLADNEDYYEDGDKIWKKVKAAKGQGHVVGDASNRPTKLPILALVDVNDGRRDLVWEITGVRAAAAVDAYTAQHGCPCTARLKRVGKDKDTDYAIESVPA